MIDLESVKNLTLNGKRENEFFENSYNYLSLRINILESILQENDANSDDYKSAEIELDDVELLLNDALEETTGGLYGDDSTLLSKEAKRKANSFFLIPTERRFDIIKYAYSRIQ